MLLDELKMLLALNGSTRIPYAEEEIFASEELYTYYLACLSDCIEDLDHDPMSLDMYAWMACSIASDIMHSRWEIAEPLIATDAQSSCEYSLYVLGSRWPKAEAVILTDSWWTYWYAKNVIGARWPEGEAAMIARIDGPEWVIRAYNRDFQTDLCKLF